MIELYTVQIGNVNNIDDETIDVDMIKSGYGMLAPTWNMVWDFKSGELSWRDYTRRYLE